MGIEPTSEAWEASILPLYDARSTLIVPANRASEKPSLPRSAVSRGASARDLNRPTQLERSRPASAPGDFLAHSVSHPFSDCAAATASLLDAAPPLR